MNLKILLDTHSMGMAVSFDHGNITITLYGDRHDEKMIAKKRSLENMGINVVIEEKDPNKSIGNMNHPFVMRYRGAALPSLNLKDLEGNSVNSETFDGKMVHILFWSTQWKMCLEEFPLLNRLRKKYENEGAVFIAIAPESEEEVAATLKKHPLSYRVVANARPLFDQLGVDSYPESFFIDREGTIVDVTDGSNYKPQLDKQGELSMKPDNFRIYDKIMYQMSQYRMLSNG